MKRTLITFAFATLAFFSADAAEKTKTYDFGDITCISAGSNFQIHVKEGKSDKVRLEYDDDIEKYATVDAVYHAGRLNLIIDQKKSFRNWNDNEVHVYLEMDKIDKIDLSGAAKASFEGNFRTEDLVIDTSGAAALSGIEINGQTLEADISGASSCVIRGNFTQKIDADLSGASKLTLNSDSEVMEGDINGAAKFRSNGNFKTCVISCTGASNAELYGKAEKAEFECSGASSIDAQKFEAKDVDVELSGASKASVYASEELHYNVSRASKLTYFGDAELFNHNDDSNVVKGR